MKQQDRLRGTLFWLIVMILLGCSQAHAINPKWERSAARQAYYFWQEEIGFVGPDPKLYDESYAITTLTPRIAETINIECEGEMLQITHKTISDWPLCKTAAFFGCLNFVIQGVSPSFCCEILTTKGEEA